MRDAQEEICCTTTCEDLETHSRAHRPLRNETVVRFAGFGAAAGVAYNKRSMTSAARVNVRAKSSEPETERTARRILAIDYGRKRIGLALSDELGVTAQPLLTMHRANRHDDVRRLREICAQNHVGHIVVGHPLHITGEAGEMAEEAARFAGRLAKELGIETELLDERLTTWEAKQTMSEAKPRSRRKGESIDAIAAAVLLREYLENRSEASRRKRSGQQ